MQSSKLISFSAAPNSWSRCLSGDVELGQNSENSQDLHFLIKYVPRRSQNIHKLQQDQVKQEEYQQHKNPLEQTWNN